MQYRLMHLTFMSMVAYFIFCHFFSLSISLVEIYAYSNSSCSSFILTIILYSTVRSYTNLLIHSQVDEYLGCFQLFSYYRKRFSEHSFYMSPYAFEGEFLVYMGKWNCYIVRL